MAFTNGFTNITGNTANLASGVTNQCLIVTATVPIELIKFTGKTQSNSTLLNWVTLTEENNNYFEIERSQDGISYSKIGDINGAGTSSIKHSYTHIDTHPFPGTNYYRLKQVDFNGESVYSDIISVNSPLKSLSVSNVQFNGNILSFNALSSNSTTITTSLFDVSGRRVIYQSYTLTGDEAASSVINLNTEGLETGIYFLQVESSNTTPQQVKILKLNGF